MCNNDFKILFWYRVMFELCYWQRVNSLSITNDSLLPGAHEMKKQFLHTFLHTHTHQSHQSHLKIGFFLPCVTLCGEKFVGHLTKMKHSFKNADNFTGNSSNSKSLWSTTLILPTFWLGPFSLNTSLKGMYPWHQFEPSFPRKEDAVQLSREFLHLVFSSWQPVSWCWKEE